VAHQRTDVVVGKVIAEGRHAGAADGGPAVLDDVEEVLVGVRRRAGGVGEVAGAEQEQRRAPGATAVAAVALDAVGVVEALAARGARGWPGIVQEPRETDREAADGRDRRRQRDQGTPHRGEDITRRRRGGVDRASLLTRNAQRYTRVSPCAGREPIVA
jgi:hypothetical protein